MGEAVWQSELLFLRDVLKNHWSSGEYPFRSSHDHGVRSLSTPTERARLLHYFGGQAWPLLPVTSLQHSSVLLQMRQ